MENKRTLIAGPWVGEFGWELFAWQAYIRSLSEHYDKTIIICRTSSKSLYTDFTNEFVHYDVRVGPSDAFFMHNLNISDSLKEIFRVSSLTLNKNTSFLLPKRIGDPPQTHWGESFPFGSRNIKPKYIKFGANPESKYDFIFHIRDRKDIRPEDNWLLENWKKLKDLLKSERIACIGTNSSSGYIEGTDDLRDMELGKIFNIIAGSKCVFGPSSGPMHLSSLCGCPHIVWSYPGNKERYEKNWNPLGTPVMFIDEYGWQPSAEYVYDQYKNWRENG